MCADARTSSRAGALRPPRRARRLRRRVRRAHQGAALARDRAPGAAGAHQPAASRRVRLRGEHRRRRGHSDPDAGPVPAPRDGAARHHAARPSATTAPGSCSCRATPRCAARDRGALRAHRRRGRAACPRLARRADRRRGGRAERGGGRAGLPAAVRRARADGRRRAPTPTRGSSGSSTSSASGSSTPSTRSALADRNAFYVVEPVVADADLQGHADGGPDRADVPRSDGPGRRVGAGARAPAVQHQHVPVLAAGASRTASSRTTARSTRCAATSTGCRRARRCSSPTCSATT